MLKDVDRKAHPGPDDDVTLAAIDRGIADAETGRTTPLEAVREIVDGWISESTSPAKR